MPKPIECPVNQSPKAGCAGCNHLWEVRCELLYALKRCEVFVSEHLDGDACRGILEVIRTARRNA